jgi:hypothetical protein
MDDKKLEEYLARQDILIEGNVATWDIRLEGDIQGSYTGTFKFRCFLTPTQRLAAGREHRELLGSYPTLATAHDDNLAFSLSQLKHRVISAPPFWTSTVQLNGATGDIPDDNVIDAVLEAAVAAELKYKAQLKQKKTDAIERAKRAAMSILKLRDEEHEGKNQEDDDQS